MRACVCRQSEPNWSLYVRLFTVIVTSSAVTQNNPLPLRLNSLCPNGKTKATARPLQTVFVGHLLLDFDAVRRSQLGC